MQRRLCQHRERREALPYPDRLLHGARTGWSCRVQRGDCAGRNPLPLWRKPAARRFGSERVLAIVLFLAVAVVAGCRGRADPDGAAPAASSRSDTGNPPVERGVGEKVFLFGAASASTVLDEIKAEFERAHADSIVRTNY